MHRQAYILLLLTTLFWGGNAIAGKLAVGHISPLLLDALRWGMAFVILFYMGRKQLRADWAAIRPKLPLLATLGMLGFTIFNVALYSALNYTSAVNASIEQAGIPMLIFMLNFLLFRVAAGVGQIAGFLMSIAGMALTASHGEPAQLLELDVNFGDAPFAAAEFALGNGALPDRQGWAIVIFTAIFPSILAQAFYIRGVELIGANRAGLFINLVPIFGTLLSIIILGEDFRAYHAIALALTFGGIWLAEVTGKRPAL